MELLRGLLHFVNPCVRTRIVLILILQKYEKKN